jgi:hypothetical protein
MRRWGVVLLLAACSHRPLPFAGDERDLATVDDLAIAIDLSSPDLSAPVDLAVRDAPPSDLAHNRPVEFAAPLRYAASYARPVLRLGNPFSLREDFILLQVDRAALDAYLARP